MRAPPSLQRFPHYPVTGGVAVLAIGVTLASWANVDISPLYASVMIRRGELWRLVTCIFPHGGVLHLAFNIYWLWIFGSVIEEVFGPVKTLALFLLFSVGASALEFAILDGGIGLSGLGYGLFGMLWILSDRDPRFHDVVDKRTAQTFVFWFFLCIVTTVTNIMPIANLEHGGGLVLGILVGYAISVPRKRVVAIAGTIVLTGFSLWAATSGRPMVNLSAAGGYDEGSFGYEALRANRNADAVRWFHDAIRYRPHEEAFWFDLAIAYRRLNDQAGALESGRRAAEEGNASAQNMLGQIYDLGVDGAGKDAKQAAVWYRRAADQGVPDAQNNLAWFLLTTDDAALHNPVEALRYAEKGVKGDEKEHGKRNPNYLDTLAEAYFANGRFAEAVKTEQEVLSLVSAQPDSEHAAEFKERLTKYQKAAAGQQ
jgi:membrane associated rhomboid family serine protease